MTSDFLWQESSETLRHIWTHYRLMRLMSPLAAKGRAVAKVAVKKKLTAFSPIFGCKTETAATLPTLKRIIYGFFMHKMAAVSLLSVFPRGAQRAR